jgi:glycosyltransferase involved in cell wall biosynthesis
MTWRPLVSIGMPLHNAERHVAEALDSLLAQDYANFELIVSDNASSDATESICRAYAARDGRISYHRSESNQGAVWNFNRVRELARGECFMWAAHDDLRAPQFISACVAALDTHPEAVLCCTGVGFMDEGGQEIEPWVELVRPVGTTVGSRVRAIARARYWLDVYGLIRAGALARTRPAQPVWGFDVVTEMELCLRGPVAYVPERLFFYRSDPRKTPQFVAAALGTAAGPGPVPVNWTAMALELARAVQLAPLGSLRKAGLAALLLAQLCVFNGLVGSGIRANVLPSAGAAWAERRWARFAVLVLMAALVFPVQNRLVRGAYRLVRPQKRTSQMPV